MNDETTTAKPVPDETAIDRATDVTPTKEVEKKSFFHQWWLAVFYVVAMFLCLRMASLTSVNTKVSIAWLFSAIVASQIVTDLYDFSDSKNKGRASATLRFITISITLLVAYNLAE